MTWEQFNRAMGKIEYDQSDRAQVKLFLNVVQEMIELLNEADMDDYFGTEGWKHRLGLE